MISKKLVAASILAAMGTSAHALDPIKVGDWDLQVSGSVNAYYTSLDCKTSPATAAAAGNSTVTAGGTGINPCGDTIGDNQSVQNGLLPGFIIFTAKTKQNGYDISGTISIDPGTSRDNGPAAGVGQNVGDQRRVFLTFGNSDIGTFKFGRDIGLFGQNAILNDMSLIAVGGGSGFNGALNTTLGSITAGYLYTEFQPQMTYTTPTLGGFSGSVGLFKARNSYLSAALSNPSNDRDEVQIQAMGTYTFSGGKAWATLVNQNGLHGANTPDSDANGYEIGGTYGIAGLSLTGNIYSGEGIGTTALGYGGHDGTKARDSDGYLVQATYTFGNTKVGVNYGESQLDATANDRTANTLMLDKNKQTVVGVYHNLTPSLTLAGEYINNKQTYNSNGGPTVGNAKANTIAVGAILFF